MKLIIKVHHDINDITALNLVDSVIKKGKISNDAKQYCYATVFTSGHIVYAQLTKTGTHVFDVYKD